MTPEYKITGPFCVSDCCTTKDQLMIQVAQVLSEALAEEGFSFQYMNVLDANPDSLFYNPDGGIGRIRIIKQS